MLQYTDNELNVLARMAWVGVGSGTGLGSLMFLARLTQDEALAALVRPCSEGLINDEHGEPYDLDNSFSIVRDRFEDTRVILTEAEMWPPRKTPKRRAATDAAEPLPRNASEYVSKTVFTEAEADLARAKVEEAVRSGVISARTGGAYKTHIRKRTTA